MKKKSLSLFYALAAMLLSAGQLSATIRYVDGSAVSGGNNGTSWADAFVTIGDAVNAADAGDEIWIAGGTYPVDNVSIDKAVTLYGGFVSGTTSRPKTPGGTSWEFTTPTVISGSGLGATRAFTIANTVTTSTDIVFDGLTFANFAQGADRAPAIYGRGRLTVNDCIIKECTTQEETNDQQPGGTITYNFAGGTATITNTLFKDNTISVKQRGGGICLQQGTMNVSGCEFNNNYARNGGGIFGYSGQTLNISNCVFKGNQSKYEGGAIDNSSNLTVTNSIFTGNDAQGGAYGYGGAFFARGGTAKIYNNVFGDNTGGTNGQAIYAASTGYASEVVNNIFYVNTPGDVKNTGIGTLNNIMVTAPANPSATTTFANFTIDLDPTSLAAWSNTNIAGTIDPTTFFTDAANGDFTLQAGTSAAGAGLGGTDIGATGNAATAQSAYAALPAITGESDYYYIYFSGRTINAARSGHTNLDNSVVVDGAYAGEVLTDNGDGVQLDVKGVTVANDATQLWKVIYNNGLYKLQNKAGNYLGYVTQYTASATDQGLTVTVSSNTLTSPNLTTSYNIAVAGKSGLNLTSTYITNYIYSNDHGCAVQFVPEGTFKPIDYTGYTWYRIQAARRITSNISLTNKGDGEKITQEANVDGPSQYWNVTGSPSSLILGSYDGLQVKPNTANDRFITATTGEALQVGYTGAKALQLKNATNYWNDISGTPREVGYYNANDPGAYFTFTEVPAYPLTVTSGANVSNVVVTAPAAASGYQVLKGVPVTITYQVAANYEPAVTANGSLFAKGVLSSDTYTLTISYEDLTEATVIDIAAAAATSLQEVTADDNAPVRYYTLQGVEVTAPVKGNIYIVKKGLKVTKLIAK